MRRALLLLFLGSFGFFGFFAHGYVESSDADVTMHSARALLLRGDPGFKASGDDTWAFERGLVQHYIARGTYGMMGRDGKAYAWFPIGHQLLMVPFVALGEALARWYPEPELEARELRGEVFGAFYWSHFLVSFLPALAAAGSVVMLLLLAEALGCVGRQALLVAVAVALCTQFWPAASETMSDGPGQFFMLAMAAIAFRYRVGTGGSGALLLAGACGGAAVLVRYPHAASVAVLGAVALHAGWRRRERAPWRETALVGLGAAPFGAVLLAANKYRFDDWFETGYSAGATGEWFSYPPWLGIPLILLAPGKGVLWFSPLLWLALALCVRRGVLRAPWLPALAVFAIPVVVFGHTAGWAAGQCWSVRYVGPGVVLLVAVALAAGRPWRRWPKLFATLCALGFLVSLGGVLTPYRGQQDLAIKAAKVAYPDVNVATLPDIVNFEPRFSPIHTHWIYAWLSASGRLDAGGSANTTEPLFGIRTEPPDDRLAIPGEDAGFRHWWAVHASAHHGLPLAPVALLWWLVTLVLLAWGARRYVRQAEPAAAP